MEHYRKVVKRRISLLSLLVLVAVGLGVYDVFWATPAITESFIFGFQLGATTALGLLALFLIMRYQKALRNETLLTIQFNKENDERLKAIRAKAGMPMLLFTSIAMILAGVIIGYFNSTVFYVLILTALFQMIVSATVKRIHMKKM